MILSSPTDLGYIPKKIISLVPSQTELLHWLGLEDETIAITKFCVHPNEWFRNKTRVGGTKALNIEKIIELAPDLIIANNEENVKDQVEALAIHFPVWVTDISNLDDAFHMIGDIGILTGKQTGAADLISKINNEFAALDDYIKSNHDHSPRTAYLIWQDPYMTIGGDTFINDMMKRCGFQNIFSRSKRYPETSVTELKELNCELLLLSSEPFPFAEKHIPAIQQHLPSTKIILVDGEMFSWYGSRLLYAAGWFREFLSVTCVS